MDKDPCPEAARMPPDLQVRRGVVLHPAQQFEQGRQIDSRLQAARHLTTEIGIHHPRRNGLPDLRTAEIQVLDISATEFPHDREVMLAKERMKWVPNRHFALVMGIIVCRVKPDYPTRSHRHASPQ